jgi:ADP-ribosyl-[dinitrogen reductase] hydrolase
LKSNKKFNKKNLADYFVKTFKKNPLDGYARGFQKFLDLVNSGEEFLEKINPYSERNGAAMRSVPLGIINDLEKVVEYAKVNASVTHDTPKGRDSSIFVGLMSYYSFHEGRVANAEKEIIPHLEDKETKDYLFRVSKMKGLDKKLLFGEEWENKGVPCDGMRTAGAVYYILNNFFKPGDVLKESVKLGGDTDSVASISLGINLMNKRVEDLPSFLFEDLFNGDYGRDYLINLCK